MTEDDIREMVAEKGRYMADAPAAHRYGVRFRGRWRSAPGTEELVVRLVEIERSYRLGEEDRRPLGKVN